MGADQWSVCPRCFKKWKEKQDKLLKDLDECYGKVPRNQYLDMIEESKLPFSTKKTFGAYFDVDLWNDGLFEISYEGSCDVCDFTVAFDYNKMMEV